MRLSASTFAVLILFGFAVFATNNVLAKTPQNGFVDGMNDGAVSNLSPVKRLSESVRMAKQGDVADAFDFARETANMYSPDKLFAIKYIETLVRISKLADDELVATVLNEGIKKVNSLKAIESYAGTGDAETAYHFMIAVGKLAKELDQQFPKVAARLKICQGRIARNLKANAMYPQNAMFSLCGALISEAQGYAAEQNLENTLSAITVASELGYFDFENLQQDKFLSELSDQEKLQQHVEKLNEAYLEQVKQWSKEEIEKFQTFVFEFNVDNVEGGSFCNGEFENKILVVDLWASWCQPCCESIPHYVKLQEQKSKDNVQVIGISMDSPDDPNSSIETVKEFMAKNEFNYPCGMGTEELKKRIPGDVKLPTTLFIDRDGVVRYMATGFHDYAKIAALTERLVEQGHSVKTSNAH